MPEASPPPTVESVLAANISHLRRQERWTQERLAAEVVLRGLAWNRLIVGAVESAKRTLSAPEVLVLADVFDISVAKMFSTGAPDVMVGDAIWPGDWYRASLIGETGNMPATSMPRSPASRVLDEDLLEKIETSRTDRGEFRKRWDFEKVAGGDIDRVFHPGPLEEQAAERLRDRGLLAVSAGDVAAAVLALWGGPQIPPSGIGYSTWRLPHWTLEEERERRVSQKAEPDASAPRLRALRGHVMRDLYDELAEEITAAFARPPASPKRSTSNKRKEPRR